MKSETFKNALGLLTQVFPNVTIPVDVWWTLLKDLYDEPFMKAVLDTCRTQKQLFPNDNLIAILRAKTFEMSKSESRLALPAGKPFSATPSKEFGELIKRLSEEKSIKRSRAS